MTDAPTRSDPSTPAVAAEALLSVTRLSKAYGGVPALDDVTVSFTGGEVHALLGENGAGKSTLVKSIVGVTTPDSGSISGSAYDAGDVAMVFQELSVIPEMSIRDNLLLAVRGRRGITLDAARRQTLIHDALHRAGLSDVEPALPVQVLSLAQQQLLEIARGLIADARVLILDEPTATLSDHEIAQVHRVIRELTAAGCAIVYITHRLGEVFDLADRVTVMRSGTVVASGAIAEFTMRDVVAAMLGTDHVPAEKTAVALAPSLGAPQHVAIRGLSYRGEFEALDIDAVGGEVLAIFGQIGSGADSVIRVAAGVDTATNGTVTVNGQALRGGSRPAFQQAGVAYISADRVNEGVFLNTSVTRNVSAGVLSTVQRAGILRRTLERTLAERVTGRVAFNTGRVTEPVSAFSGGNQQKVAIARALATEPKVLILNEPTRGVDIGARSEIYRSIRDLAAQNVAVVIYSSDVLEVRELADRVITMYRGKQVATHTVDDVDNADIVAEILNGAAA